MFKFAAILFSLSIAITGISQKVKSQNFTVKYTVPAIYAPTPSKHVNVLVHETARDKEGELKTISISTPKQALELEKEYYFNKWLFKEFKIVDENQSENEKDTLSLITLTVGELKILSETNISENLTKEGKVVGKKWQKKLLIEIPSSYTFEDENGKTFVEQNEQSQFEILFPKDFWDYRTAVYTNIGALNTAYNNDKGKILFKAREEYFEKYIRQESKFIVNHSYPYHKNFFNCQFYYIKGVKKTKDQFKDFEELMIKTEATFAKIRANFDAKNEINWHSEEIQADFASIKKMTEDIMQKDIDDQKAGRDRRMDDETFIKLYRNIMWCDFFMNDFQSVRDQAVEQYAKRSNISKDQAIQDITTNELVTWYGIYHTSMDYEEVYNTRRSAKGW